MENWRIGELEKWRIGEMEKGKIGNLFQDRTNLRSLYSKFSKKHFQKTN